jgi:FlaA1/EpsC-like NDP-sugar epimerase
MKHLRLIKTILDLIVWTFSIPIAYVIRLETESMVHWVDILILTLISIPIKLALIVYNRQNSSSWRFAGITEYQNIAYSIGTFVVFLVIVKLFLGQYLMIPWSLPILELGLGTILLTGIRIGSKLWPRTNGIQNRDANDPSKTKRVIIAGAGEAGVAVSLELRKNARANYTLVGFLDDDPSKQSQIISGLKVLGGMSSLGDVIKKTTVDEVIIAMPSAPGSTIRQVVDHASAYNVSYKIIPSLADIIHRQAPINQLRPVELEDLLGRPSVKLDEDIIKDTIFNRVVLVTGAGGSIGSEIVRQLVVFKPKHLLLVGRGENSLHQLRLELNRHSQNQSFEMIICDVRDRDTLEHIFSLHKPEVVFHAAAHKHVRLMQENPEQAVFNNVTGTQNVVDLSIKHGVRSFVNISTDKAINPSSIMGASKRVTELITQQASFKASDDQAFMSVRFGNVLGSRGSVVNIFNDQIKHGGPVTVTHPDTVRYFMTVEESAQLVLQACAMHINGCIFMLKMGDPVRILDMARDLIRLSGYEPDRDIHVVFSGLTEGEKLFEELLYNDEHHQITSHEKVLISRSSRVPSNLDDLVSDLTTAARNYDIERMRVSLNAIIPTFAVAQQSDPAFLDSLESGLTGQSHTERIESIT